jgi:acyl-coenzyme A synthetase/AMP-(fatty) acid ligase
VVVTADGVVTPVGIEHRVEALADVALAAVVGVGPPDCQQMVVVVETTEPTPRPTQASTTLADAVRAAVGVVDVAAVLVVPKLPVDIRHNSKIDRARVAKWATRLLAGEKAGRL